MLRYVTRKFKSILMYISLACENEDKSQDTINWVFPYIESIEFAENYF